MDKYTFSTQNNKAYYYNTIPDFIHDDSNSIVGQLVRYSVNQTFEVNQETFSTWENQISELKSRLSLCGIDGDIIFEYDIVRLGKRIDVNHSEQADHC